MFQENALPLHSQSDDKADANIGIWCNGNTPDSGPVILGSSPSIPTMRFQMKPLFLLYGPNNYRIQYGSPDKHSGGNVGAHPINSGSPDKQM